MRGHSQCKYETVLDGKPSCKTFKHSSRSLLLWGPNLPFSVDFPKWVKSAFTPHGRNPFSSHRLHLRRRASMQAHVFATAYAHADLHRRSALRFAQRIDDLRIIGTACPSWSSSPVLEDFGRQLSPIPNRPKFGNKVKGQRGAKLSGTAERPATTPARRQPAKGGAISCLTAITCSMYFRQTGRCAEELSRWRMILESGVRESGGFNGVRWSGSP